MKTFEVQKKEQDIIHSRAMLIIDDLKSKYPKAKEYVVTNEYKVVGLDDVWNVRMYVDGEEVNH
ncbi:hypothetical protein [Brumimicrobium mesophilum]|uniref:hypothetical protein n=1 Tax=Brumimicrobium mesophilum TaxID=392717 RepID=UPI000D143EE3|nr:hypothetical protein [Brumimicrobium mesophilum]